MPQLNKQKKKNRDFRLIILIVVLLLLLLLIFLFLTGRAGRQKEMPGEPQAPLHTPGHASGDTSPDPSLLTKNDSLTDTVPVTHGDTISNKRKPPTATVPDSAIRAPKSSLLDSGTSSDTIPPELAADPTGGLYYQPINVRLLGNEPCSIFYVKSPNVILLVLGCR